MNALNSCTAIKNLRISNGLNSIVETGDSQGLA
jgi:hypothetical protein